MSDEFEPFDCCSCGLRFEPKFEDEASRICNHCLSPKLYRGSVNSRGRSGRRRMGKEG